MYDSILTDKAWVQSLIIGTLVHISFEHDNKRGPCLVEIVPTPLLWWSTSHPRSLAVTSGQHRTKRAGTTPASHHPSNCTICVPSMFQSWIAEWRLIWRREIKNLQVLHSCLRKILPSVRYRDIACWRGRPFVLPHLGGHHFHHFPELGYFPDLSSLPKRGRS